MQYGWVCPFSADKKFLFFSSKLFLCIKSGSKLPSGIQTCLQRWISKILTLGSASVSSVRTFSPSQLITSSNILTFSEKQWQQLHHIIRDIALPITFRDISPGTGVFGCSQTKHLLLWIKDMRVSLTYTETVALLWRNIGWKISDFSHWKASV
jgi:hypothetical protein